MLDQYQILRTIAKGEHSTVKLVQNREGKQFSAKIMRYSTDSSKLLVSSLLKNELKILRSIQSSHTIQAVASSFEGKLTKHNKSTQCVYLISSYCSLGSFVHLCQLRPSESEARHFFLKLLTNVENIQSEGVKSLNLRLENVLIDESLNVKLCGFSMSSMNEDESIKKKNVYSAPEVLEFKKAKAEKVSVFALGVALFMLVVGRPPFYRACSMDSLYKILQNNRQHFWGAFPRVSGEFKEIIQGMLKENPEERMGFKEIKTTKWVKAAGNEDLSEIHAKILRSN